MKNTLLIAALAGMVVSTQAGEFPGPTPPVPVMEVNDTVFSTDLEVFGGILEDGDTAAAGISLLANWDAFGLGVESIWSEDSGSDQIAYNIGPVVQYELSTNRLSLTPLLAFRFIDINNDWEYGVEAGGKLGVALTSSLDFFVRAGYTWTPDYDDGDYASYFAGLRLKF